jgi:hypothetical protein
VKAMKSAYQSESKINPMSGSTKSGISGVSTSIRNPENVGSWRSATGAGRKATDDPTTSLRNPEQADAWKKATGATAVQVNDLDDDVSC